MHNNGNRFVGEQQKRQQPTVETGMGNERGQMKMKLIEEKFKRKKMKNN